MEYHSLTFHSQTFHSLREGNLSGLYLPPAGDDLLVLAHGAGAPHNHVHMNAIADALGRQGIGTLRFNFPFMEAGKRRVDSVEVSCGAIEAALNTAAELSPGSRLLLGGHSFGGRMASHLAAEKSLNIAGLVFFSFPLHVAKKPATTRAAHLPMIQSPMLFLSGTRDALAEPALLEEVVNPLPRTTLHWLDTADHSFKILKRTRESAEDVYDEAARIAAEWSQQL